MLSSERTLDTTRLRSSKNNFNLKGLPTYFLKKYTMSAGQQEKSSSFEELDHSLEKKSEDNADVQSISHNVISSRDADATLKFMEENDSEVPEAAPEEEKKAST
ncbi:hypothetical protein HII13_004513 [Brettanomyces bruxellensis]|nr:hypothetical protein HII13_004513 [Brettanomyces bruxellensis]